MLEKRNNLLFNYLHMKLNHKNGYFDTIYEVCKNIELLGTIDVLF